MAPGLLAMAEVQTLQGLRLMQPVSGTIHGAIVAALAGPVAGAADGPDSKPVRVHHAPWCAESVSVAVLAAGYRP